MTKMKKCFLVVLYLAIIVINTAATDEHNITDSKQFERTQYIGKYHFLRPKSIYSII